MGWSSTSMTWSLYNVNAQLFAVIHFKFQRRLIDTTCNCSFNCSIHWSCMISITNYFDTFLRKFSDWWFNSFISIVSCNDFRVCFITRLYKLLVGALSWNVAKVFDFTLSILDTFVQILVWPVQHVFFRSLSISIFQSRKNIADCHCYSIFDSRFYFVLRRFLDLLEFSTRIFKKLSTCFIFPFWILFFDIF